MHDARATALSSAAILVVTPGFDLDDESRHEGTACQR
jgi:hypothetical protein